MENGVQLLGFDDDDRPFLAVPAALVGLVTVLVTGVAVGHAIADDQEPASGTRAAGTAGAGGDCQSAVEEARTALQAAMEVDAALAVHTEVLNDLRAERLTTRQALARAAPVLTDGARRSSQLDVATQRFLQLANDCQR